MRFDFLAVAVALIIGGCSPTAPVTGRASGEAQASILAGSRPAAGTSVQGPVEKIELWFSPGARLAELVVTGADGLTMPTMVTAVGEVGYYSIPVSGLPEGNYTVRWRASAAGQSHAGSFQFVVR